MTLINSLALLGVVCGWAIAAQAQLQLSPDREVQRRFAGEGRSVNVVFHNTGAKTLEVEMQTRLFQASSATAIPLGTTAWKKLQVLANQTVVESAAISFPAVKVETRFLVQWLEASNYVVGVTEVFIYPTNLLRELKPMVGEEPLGVFDPQNQFKPLLKNVAVEFQDLLEDGTDKFRGKVAIFGPFESKKQSREKLAEDIRALARRGVAVVWLQPPREARAPLKPSFYTVRVGSGAVVVAQGEMLSRLADDPQAQLNLIRLTEAALRPEALDLPEARNSN